MEPDRILLTPVRSAEQFSEICSILLRIDGEKKTTNPLANSIELVFLHSNTYGSFAHGKLSKI